MEKLFPRHVEIIEMIDEELIQNIVSEYGTSDPDMLKKKLKAMRILENFYLPASLDDIFVKPKEISAIDLNEEPKESSVVGNGGTEGSSVIDLDKEKKVPNEAALIDDEYELEEKDSQEKNEYKFEEKDPQEKKESDPEPVLILQKMFRMAHLCVVGGHAVNGVAEIHSEIVKEDVCNDFYKNKTNGVTPRRWIRFCNPNLIDNITKWIGTEDWVLNTEKLEKLREVKRIHEYKRQLLNIGDSLSIQKMKEMKTSEREEKFVPRVCIFGGKAFATYVQAKRIVKFITDVGATINHDPEIGDLLKVIFVLDYNVSVAELLIPSSELSQHISTAGMEASGTSNMKFAMNGCIVIGTLDGANVEIREEVGEDNFFLFGAQAHEISGLREERAEGKFVPAVRFQEVKDYVKSGIFGSNSYDELLGSLEGNESLGRADYFLVGKDSPSYIECQEKVDEAYQDQKIPVSNISEPVYKTSVDWTNQGSTEALGYFVFWSLDSIFADFASQQPSGNV